MEAGDNGALTSLAVEVMAKPVRRRFTAEYKLGVLREVDRCKGRGELGTLLRREGLYSSHLTQWRKQRERGERQGLSRKRGPAPKQRHPLVDKVKVLERDNARLKLRAERAEGLVELQKKVSEILGIELKQSAEQD